MTPSKSNRSQEGLYHGKTHHKRYKYSFSHRKSIVTFKPNINVQTLKSDTLDRVFKIEVSTKAMKCIIKAGSLDNYLL